MPGSARWRDKDGVWVLQAYAGKHPETGKSMMRSRVFRAPHTKEGRQAAVIAASEFYLEVKAGVGGRPSDELSLTQACRDWAKITAMQKQWSPKSVAEATRVIDDRIAVDPIGLMQITDIRAKHLDAYYMRLLASGGKHTNGPLAPGTVRKAHAVIHAALQRQVKHDALFSNPATAASPPRVPERRLTPPAPEDVKKALKHAEGDVAWYAYLRLEATTGARRGQMCGLRWSQIDWRRGELTWDRAIVVHKKTEEAPDGFFEKSTKTNRVYRNALDDNTMAALAALHAHADSQLRPLGLEVAKDAFVFCRDLEGTQPWRPDSVTRRWRTFADRLGMQGVRHHDLRHYLATYLLDAGEDPNAVAQRLGWASAYTLMKVYAGRVPAADQRSAEMAAGFLDH